MATASPYREPQEERTRIKRVPAPAGDYKLIETLRCNGELHDITLNKRGRLVAWAHRGEQEKADLAVESMGGALAPCVAALRAWRSNTLGAPGFDRDGPFTHEMADRSRVRHQRHERRRHLYGGSFAAEPLALSASYGSVGGRHRRGTAEDTWAMGFQLRVICRKASRIFGVPMRDEAMSANTVDTGFSLPFVSMGQGSALQIGIGSLWHRRVYSLGISEGISDGEPVLVLERVHTISGGHLVIAASKSRPGSGHALRRMDGKMRWLEWSEWTSLVGT